MVLLPVGENLRGLPAPSLVVIALIAAVAWTPAASAQAIAFCDVLGDRCVGAAVFGAEGCVQAYGDLSVFPGKTEFTVCGAASTAVGGSVALAIGTAVVSASALVENVHADIVASDACVGVDKTTASAGPPPDIRMTWVACGAAAAAYSSEGCFAGEAKAKASNALGPLPTALANGNIGDCEEGIEALKYKLLPPMGEQGQASWTPGSVVPVEELPAEIQEQWRAYVQETLRIELGIWSGAWPDDDIHNAFRATIENALEEAVARGSGSLVVYATG